MLEAGKKVLLEIEPSMGFEQLTYSAVFEHLQQHYDQRVTIGSVHERIWKSQRDYQLDVVAAVLGEPVAPTSGLVLQLAGEALKQFDLTTPANRRYALQTAIRLNSEQLFDRPHAQAIKIAHQVRFQLWALGPEHPEAIGFIDAIKTIRRASTDAYTAVARVMIKTIGLRVRDDAGDPEAAIESIAVLGNAVILGLQSDAIEQAHKPRMRATGPNGELEEWYPDTIAIWSYVAALFELDGDDLSPEERRL